jgi:hypothetical protein
MEEDLTAINSNVRSEKIRNFLIKNKKTLISITITLILILLSFYSYQVYKADHKESLSNKYNAAVIEYKDSNKSNTILTMREIVEDKDDTYSPLALYFIIDKNLIEDKKKLIIYLIF